MDSIKEISIDLLDDHPDNPRLFLRDNVVGGIAAQLEDKGYFDPAHALLVRPLNGRYQIIDGHHRKYAAIMADLAEIPCWIREMSDEDAYLELGLSNAQGELSSLEIGRHARGLPDGKWQDGLREYARQMGQHPQNVSTYRQGAEVLNFVLNIKCNIDITLYVKKALHLAAIHNLPQELWPIWTEWIVTPNNKGQLPSSKKATAVARSIQSKVVKALRGDDNNIPNKWESVFLSIEILAERLLGNNKALPAISQLIDLADKTEELIAQNAEALAPVYTVEKYHDWLGNGIGEDSWDRGQLRARWRDVLEMVKDKLEIVYTLWLACRSTEEIKKETGLSQAVIESLIEEAQTAYYEDIKPDSCQTFNLWKFTTCDVRYGVDYPGRIPGQIVENVLYFYTQPFDIVVDPMAGGGTTLDVCKAMRRRYRCYDIEPIRDDIEQHDLTTGFPEECQGCNLIFLDPPYWKQKQGDYSEDETNLANLPLDEFYKEMDKIFNGAFGMLADSGHIAVIIGPTQEQGQIHDHALRFAKMLADKFVYVSRIIVPYTTQQAKAYHVTDARDGRYMLKLYRDLLIYRKG